MEYSLYELLMRYSLLKSTTDLYCIDKYLKTNYIMK